MDDVVDQICELPPDPPAASQIHEPSIRSCMSEEEGRGRVPAPRKKKGEEGHWGWGHRVPAASPASGSRGVEVARASKVRSDGIGSQGRRSRGQAALGR
jgi:hypothetical protein